MEYEQMFAWSKVYDLVMNRVKVANHMLGGSYDGCVSNPFTVRMVRGRYRVLVGGEELTSFRVYDLDGTNAAYDQLDIVTKALWLVRRGGYTLS